MAPSPVLNRSVVLLRIAGKFSLLIVYFWIAASLIDASKFISYEASSRFSAWVYGYSSQDNFDDLWFFTNVILSIITAIVLYIVTLMFIAKLRKK